MNKLQEIQNNFSEATGLAAIAVGKNGEYITEGSNFTDFCMKYTRGSKEGNRRCVKCDNECSGTYFCHAGLMDFSVDIVVNGEKMGAITGMSVEARSSSGSILTLDLTYECGIVKIKTEYNIRKILGCMVKKIVYADATESENITMLPSAFSTVEKQEDGTYLLSGGGYGHGLGMSQNGANEMAKEGYTWQEILAYFFQNITFETVPS